MPCRLSRHSLTPATTLALLAAACWPVVATATDLDGVQPAAFDQPRINVIILPAGSDTPYIYDGINWEDFSTTKAFHIDDAYFDTGASGVLLSEDTATTLGITNNTQGGKSVIYGDVGVAGSDLFHTSTNVDIAIAPYHPDVATQISNAEDAYTQTLDVNALHSALSTIFTQKFSNVRTQVGPIGGGDPALGSLDVFGIPLMTGKVVVMDPKPVNAVATVTDPFELLGITMHTYVYNPGTAYNAAAADTNPGIPQTSRHVKLTFASFDRFTDTYLLDETTQQKTSLTPQEAAALRPTLAPNPFIGPNPLHAIDPSVPAGNAPPITVTFGDKHSTGTWLLDTGGSASMISSAQAAKLGVFVGGTADEPVLMDAQGNVMPNQFTLPIGGIGGTKNTVGFYLTSLLLPTKEGALISTPDGLVADPNDPNHIRFLNAPVLINDITLMDPQTSQTLTLDGVLGMNFFVASTTIDMSSGLPVFGDFATSAFDWMVFDQPNAELGLTLSVPEPASVGFLCIAALLLPRRRFAA